MNEKKWKNGMMEEWNIGVMEWWIGGTNVWNANHFAKMSDRDLMISSFHHSTLPLSHYSIVF